jgi:hypothetical protein
MTPDRVTRDDAAYEALLASLADGVDIDWGALDAAATTDVERRRNRNLRLVARVAEVYRTLSLEGSAPDVPGAASESGSRD